MARKSKDKGEGGGLPGWMATYGDMVTLLLCFFVLLFAMSTIDANKFKKLAYALSGTFGVMPNGNSINSVGVLPANQTDGKGSFYKYQTIAKKIKDDLEKVAIEDNTEYTEEELSKIFSDTFTVEIREKGIVISVADQFLFESGKAVLKQDAEHLLNQLLETLAGLSNFISVEGHTDNVPINTLQFPSNWELSGARAASVVKYFVKKKPEMSKRIFLAGYGDTKPRATNATIQGRKANRRIEILILKSIDEQYEEKISQEINTTN